MAAGQDAWVVSTIALWQLGQRLLALAGGFAWCGGHQSFQHSMPWFPRRWLVATWMDAPAWQKNSAAGVLHVGPPGRCLAILGPGLVVLNFECCFVRLVWGGVEGAWLPLLSFSMARFGSV